MPSVQIGLTTYNADLRNAIVHERSDGHVIAEPHDYVTNQIKLIYAHISDPPKLIPKFQTKEYSLGLDNGIGHAVKLMKERSFSQLPILNGGNFVGLLTASTVCRWLGANQSEDIFSLSETGIEEVLKHTEDPENFAFMARAQNVFELLEVFRNFQNRGKFLEAILITEKGKSTESLMGILNADDLPRIFEYIKL